MPLLTQYQKDYVLKNRGLNPAEYDIDENSNIIQKEQPDVLEQPSISPSQYGPDKFPSNTTTPQDSPLKTFGKNLAENIPSAVAGGLGIAAGSAATAGTGGLAAFLIPLLGGLGASYGAKRLQQAVEPEAWQKNVQESSAENPKSAIAGNLAAIPFGGFSPNPVNTVKGVGTLGKTLIGAETTLPEMQNLLNVGGGAAISGGLNAAQQAISPQPFSIPEVLKAAGEGALFNDPKNNPLGRRLFPHAAPETIHDRLRGGLDQVPQRPAVDVESTVTPADEAPPEKLRMMGEPSPADIAVQQSIKAFKDAQAELQKTHIDAQTAQIEQQTKDLQTAVKEHEVAHAEEKVPIETPATVVENKSPEPVKFPAGPNDLPLDQLPKPNVEEVIGNNPRQPFDYKDTTPKPDVRIDNPRFSQPTPEAQTSAEADFLKNKNIPKFANDKWHNTLNEFLKSKGIEVSDNNQLVNAKTQEPVAGKTTIDGKGVANLIETNPQKRGADTHMHEGFHAFISALRKSSRSSDQRMIRDYDRLTNESPDYQQWKADRDAAKQDSSVEEYQATNEGYQFLNRHLNLQHEGPLKEWVNDFKTYLKTRFTKYGTAEDYQRLLDYKLTHGRKTFSEIAGGLPPSHASTIATSRLSDDSKINPTAEEEKAPDWIRYAHTWPAEPRIGLNEPMDMFHIDKDIEGHSKDSTLSRKTLESMGYKVPEIPKTEKLSESSKLASSRDEQIKMLINTAAEHPSLKDVDAKEIRNILIKKVDWEDMPSVKSYVESKLFDRKSNESWQYLKNLYDKYAAKPTIAESIEKLSPSIPKEDEVKPPAIKPEKPITKSVKEATKEVPANRFEELKPEDLAKEKTLAQQDWDKIDSTKQPKLLAAEFRERYDKALQEKEDMQRQGFKRHSSEMQMLERRINGLKYKYDFLRDKTGIHEPPIEAEDRSEYSTKSSIPSVLRPEVQRIRDSSHVQSDDMADAFEKVYEKKRSYTGSLNNEFMGKILPTISKTDLKGQFFQNTKEMQDVLKRREELRDFGHSSITLNPKAQKIEDILQQNNQNAQDARAAFPRLSKRIDFTKPDFLPQTPARKVVDTLTQKQGSPEYQQLMQNWDDYYTNVLHKTSTEADDAFGEFISVYKRRDNPSLAKHYSPIDNAEQIMLPPEFREKSLVDLVSRFNARVGRRLAYHSEIEQNPVAMHLLESDKDGLASNKHVKNVMDDLMGTREHDEANRTAAGGLIRAAMLGPLTGAKDLLSNFTLGMQHMTLPQSIVTPLKALSDISTNIKESFEAGVNRYNISALEMGDEGNLSNLTRRIRDVVSTAQGRNFLEKVTRGVAYGQGKLVAMDNLWSAHNNSASKQQLKFLDDFAPDWKTSTTGGQFTPEQLMDVASKYVESVQGTYDLRGLPAISQKGSLVPYLALTRWNIEKLNNFDKYVIQPAKAGNLTPLLMSTIGMVLGGEAVNQLVQVVTNRKEKTPNYKELQAIYEEPEGKFSQALLYKAAGLASLSGFAGIYGDLSKAGMDIWFKNSPQQYNNPLISEGSAVAENLVFAIDAMRQGNFDIGLEGINQVMQDFLQSYRIASTYLDPKKAQETDKANKLRDLKLFKSTTGMPVSSPSSDTENPFMDRDTKEFKTTADVSKAVELLPQLIQRAFERADGNIDRLHTELSKIKQNNYQTMPSPETMPQSFIRFMNRLSQTQGADAASERFTDYLLQNAKNRMKSEMVPSL